MHINIILKGACLLLLFFTSQSVISQKYFHGVLEDAQTLLPVGNVNIFYGDSGIGTVSNNEGAFELIVPENTPEQQLHFKHLIYKELTVDNALDKVTKLNGYYYTGNDIASNFGYDTENRQVGVSAQEVESILPEVVKTAAISLDGETDYKTVQYEKLVPLLIEAIKEQQAQIDELKKQHNS